MTAPDEHPQLPLGLSLRESARFDNFYAGENGEAVMALQLAAQGEGESLVYLAGKSGFGKSHLLQAACHLAAANGTAAVYLPLQDLRTLSPDVLEGQEQMGLLCLDDIDAIAGDPDWETAVFNLFNAARAVGNVMLFAGSNIPAECDFRLPDLVTRLGWGLTYTLKPLDDSQLQAALELRARGRGLELPDDTAQYLLKRISRDLPSVFDLFDRLDEASMVEQRRLTIPFVKSVLGIDSQA